MQKEQRPKTVSIINDDTITLADGLRNGMVLDTVDVSRRGGWYRWHLWVYHPVTSEPVVLFKGQFYVVS